MKRLNEKKRLYLMRCSRYQLKKRRNIVKKQKRFIDWFILLGASEEVAAICAAE